MEANLFSNTRIEAYVRVSFCGSQAITSVVCVRGRARLAPEFNEELWLPVTEPTETRRISVGLWNYSSHTRDRPIAHLYFDLDDIERSSKYISGSFLGGGLLEQNNYMGPRPRWYNLYGAPMRFGPDIVVQVWDRDVFSSNTPRALLRFPLTKCHVLASEGSKIPSPSWENLTSIGAEPISSQILMSAALIRKRDLSERLGRSECIIPQMRQAWVEITCVGVRQLKAHRLRAPQEPYVRIDVPAPNDRGNCFRTQPSSVPSGRNANFLERKVMAIDMPENPLYAPNLRLLVAGRKFSKIYIDHTVGSKKTNSGRESYDDFRTFYFLCMERYSSLFIRVIMP